jgi:hypothetical protein
MDFVTLIQIVFVAFLAWGGVLSLYITLGEAWNFPTGSMKAFGYTSANDFETGFRRLLSRQSAAAVARSGSIA